MSSSRIMKWISGGFEALLAIPVLGGSIIIGLYWTPLVVMFIIHLVTLILSIKDKTSFYGSILGLVTSVVGFIPFVGWMLHVITAILLMVDASRSEVVPTTVAAETSPQNVMNVVASNVGQSVDEKKDEIGK